MTPRLLTDVPTHVRIVEVSPRDGLQNEAVILSTQDKLVLIQMLVKAGFREVEVTSFVSPKRVPQLADAADVFAGLSAQSGVRYSALVPNAMGLERAVSAGVQAIAFFTSASQTFNRKNIGMSLEGSLETFRSLMPFARQHRLWVRAYVSTAFVCPFEGIIQPSQVIPIVQELQSIGVDEVSLGDTIGHATPDMVARLTEALKNVLPVNKTAYHFHDTLGFALANVLMALQYGISIFDSSTGGVGGCPFAPGAAGNLASETLILMLHRMHIETGIDRNMVMAAAEFLNGKLGRHLSTTSKFLDNASC